MSELLLRLAARISAALPAGLRSGFYRLGPLTGFIRKALNRAAPPGLTKIHVAAGLLEGAEFRLDLHSEKDLWLGTYEAALLERLPDWIKPGMTVYDIGANIGYLTIGFARLVGPEGRVHAFEPLPSNLARLQRALADNNVESRIVLVASAVAEKGETATFLVHKSGGMGKLQGAFGRQADYLDEIEVPLITLDAYLQQQAGRGPDWVKLDVEGGEGAVVAGAARMLELVRPNWLIELHGPEAAAAVWGRIAKADYRFFSLSQPGKPIGALAELNWKAYLMAVPVEKVEATFGPR